MEEHFQKLEPEKQRRILNAGYLIFGKHGYNKASTADIAKTAGISKAMLFYYFTSKKGMYLYLIRRASDMLVDAMCSQTASMPTDFFERLLELSRIKIQVLKTYPYLSRFLYSIYTETDPAVRHEISESLASGAVLRNDMMVLHTDAEKFKEGIQPEFVMEMITNCAFGLFSIGEITDYEPEIIDQRMDRFKAYLALMRNNFYKEPYLSEPL